MPNVGRRTLLTLAVLVAGAAIVFARRPDQFTNPQLWAEDGIFFFQARTQSWEALGLELAGYLHLAPRLIAAIASWIDPLHVPRVFALCALALTLYTMSRVLSDRCPLPFRSGCALALVLAPDASEVLLHGGNIQWILALGFVALLIAKDPQTAAQHAHDYFAALLFGLSGPFSIMLTPLFAWRLFVRRSAASKGLLAIVAACALIQSIVIFRHPQPVPAGSSFDLSAALAFPGARIAGGLFFGSWQTAAANWPLSAIITCILLIYLIAITLRSTGATRDHRLMLSLSFAGLLAGTILRCWHSLPALGSPGNADRYVFPLQVLLIWMLFSHLHSGHRVRVCFISAAAAWAIVTNASRLRIPALPDKQWAYYASRLREGEEVTVPINPDGWSFPFPARKPN